ncbi:VOC family protein [Corynebacterium variabile]|uniref:VOC family protein n=1 Tax=Corynebacterium variabile TaxID=1727 RepID=UPI003F932C67
MSDPRTGLSIHTSFLPHLDPEASLAFYRDVLGFEVRLDVGCEAIRWITVGPVGQPDTAIVLHPVGVGSDLSDEETALLTDLVAKGTYFGVNLATADLDATFDALVAAGADIVQEPVNQDYGLRDAAVRDPAGNLLRIQETPTQEGKEHHVRIQR